MKNVTKQNCLATVYPDRAVLWHPTKNGDLTPHDVIAKGVNKVWWKCPVADDHEWEAVVANITTRRSGGCPCCHGLKVVLSNCFATTHPEKAKLWHPTKNGCLTPYDITAKSHKRVWWKCPVADDHEWDAVMANVMESTSDCPCPYCVGRRVAPSNCFATTHPNKAKLWHPTKNGDLTPYDIVANSNKKVWWKCPAAEDHEWPTTLNNITQKTSEHPCPYCCNQRVVLSNCFATTHPEKAKLWHPTKNKNLTPYQFVAGSGRKVWWKCPVADDHEWDTSVRFVALGRTGCPRCNISKGEAFIAEWLQINDLQFERQYRIKECKNNKPLPFDFVVFIDNNYKLIEYQGSQHFTAFEFFGGQKGFKHRQRNDQIKHNYCNTHNIPLLCIPYWLTDDEIIQELEQFIQCDASTNEPEPPTKDEKSSALCASA